MKRHKRHEIPNRDTLASGVQMAKVKSPQDEPYAHESLELEHAKVVVMLWFRCATNVICHVDAKKVRGAWWWMTFVQCCC